MIRIDHKQFEQSPAECLQKVRAGETLVITQDAAPSPKFTPFQHPPRQNAKSASSKE
ncbi:MAG TPA: hypothetical protein VH253_05795 [Phycisphaerae bacterium]|nr:hypothetical protein [Phycisphaerae bacterium]